jgi:CRISPR/Cas system-associated protein endoribonuclease Cas2
MVTGSKGGKAPEMLDVRFPVDDNIVAVSTIKEDGVYLLLSNFVPRDKRFNYYKLNTMRQLLQKTSLSTEEKTSLKDCFEKGKGKNKKKAVLSCMEGFMASITDKQKIETFSLLKKMVNCFTQDKDPSINRIQSCVRDTTTNLGYPENKELGRWVSDHLKHAESLRSVTVNIKNLPFDADQRAVIYTIDKSHSNSCRFNKITEPSPTNTSCGIGGSVDQAVWKTLADAEKTAANSLHEFLLTKGYNRDQLSFLGESINDYKNETKRKDCIDRLIKKGFRMKDLKAGIKTFRDARRGSIVDQIEKINNRQEIALEGSKRTIASESKKGIYSLNLSMDSNSVLLIVLKKG